MDRSGIAAKRRYAPRATQDWLAADLAQPFDLTRVPLMRLAVLRTGKERQQFVWSFHHILLDGWSVPLLLGEVFSFYRAEVEGSEVQVEASRPYGDYIRWLSEQQSAAAEQYWRRALAGFEGPAELEHGRPWGSPPVRFGAGWGKGRAVARGARPPSARENRR
jgi:hypothetical protein